jgi:penicillin-binding protein 2
MFRRFFKKRYAEHVDPDEVLLDAYNLPAYNRYQLEGRLESPLSQYAPLLIMLTFLLVGGLFIGRLTFLQVVQGAHYSEQSERNGLAHSILFAERGVVRDRNGELLVWNEPVEHEPYASRGYADYRGLAHVIGYVRLPRRDTSGFFHRTQSEGVTGIELAFDERLRGTNGLALIETDALGRELSRHAMHPTQDGDSLMLTVDARLHDALYELIETRVRESRFESGTSVIMDITTGDIVALVSYPEFDLRVMSHATSTRAIQDLQNDSRKLFVNRAVTGLYTPGSIVKPMFALGALEEGIIAPERQILSTGALVVPNPYTPSQPTIFRDWRAHGLVDMRRAVAVSSNVYFFHIGGGFQQQPGLGITRLEKYARMFGLAEPTGIELGNDPAGVIPNPAWKKELFDDEWRLGDTYNTSIGQYAMQITPLQAARATAAVAARGRLVTPRLVLDSPIEHTRLPIADEHFTVIHDGMRQAVTEGTAQALQFPWLSIAAKTGTAEVGVRKELVNSWIIGYFPHDAPKYAFATLMERAPAGTMQGSPYVMHHFFQWMREHAPEYME